MQAHGRLQVVVGHPVDVLACRTSAASRWSASGPPARHAAEPSGPDRRVLLGQGAAEDDEGAGAAAVVVPVGALAGHPGEQPRLEVALARRAGRSSGRAGSNLISGDQSSGCSASRVAMAGEFDRRAVASRHGRGSFIDDGRMGTSAPRWAAIAPRRTGLRRGLSPNTFADRLRRPYAAGPRGSCREDESSRRPFEVQQRSRSGSVTSSVRPYVRSTLRAIPCLTIGNIDFSRDSDCHLHDLPDRGTADALEPEFERPVEFLPSADLPGHRPLAVLSRGVEHAGQ